MTESEKFIFKTLQWIIALGVTLLVFGMGYFIEFDVSMYNFRRTHERAHDKMDKYVIERLYIDSINCQDNRRRIGIIESRLTDVGINEIEYPKSEAALNEKKKYKQSTNN